MVMLIGLESLQSTIIGVLASIGVICHAESDDVRCSSLFSPSRVSDSMCCTDT